MENKKTILIVEDDKQLNEILSKKFIKEGFRVLNAFNGEEGLGIYMKENPDLILLDIIMPIMDGVEMLRKVRRKEDGKHVPVIVLTNLSEADKTAESLEHGVFDYLVKSDWKLDDVVMKVKERLNLK